MNIYVKLNFFQGKLKRKNSLRYWMKIKEVIYLLRVFDLQIRVIITVYRHISKHL